MTWNKDNPRFKRPAMSGGGRKKNKGLVGRFKDSLDGLLNKKDEPQRLQPPPPAELIDDLKLAMPKPKPQRDNPPPQSGDDSMPRRGDVPPQFNGGLNVSAGKEPDSPSAVNDGGHNAKAAKAPWPRPERQLKSENRMGGPGSHEMSFSKSEASPLHPDPQMGEPSPKAGGASNLAPGKSFDAAPKTSMAKDSSEPGETRKLFSGKRRPIRQAPASTQSGIDKGLGCDPIINGDEADDVCRPPRRKIRPVKARPGEASPRALDGPAEKKPEGPFAAEQKPPRTPADEQPQSAAADAGPKPDESPKDAGITAAKKSKSGRALPFKMSRPLIVALACVGLAVAIIAGARLVFFSEPSRPTAKVARIPQASLPKVPPIEPGFFELYSKQRADAPQTSVTIEPGGSLGKALEALGIGAKQDAGALTRYMTNDDIAPVVLPGDVLRAFWADKSKTRLGRLEYIPTAQNMKAEATPLVIMRGADGKFWHYRPSPPLLTLSAAREATIESSLWAAGSKAGLDAGIIVNITEILASDIDFMTNIQRGDNFQVLYSREYRDGRPKGQPIIDMIKLTNRGKTYEYYRFVNQGDQVGYYDPNGRSAQKSFFMTPLQYKRISSQFSMTRLHPIHKVVRPHQGVDYAAPAGTPVSAVADGTVIFCGWNGGYGKLVTIKHDATYTTMYAHLSKFASGLQKGSVVKQGDLIGYVGATGTATGPHLDFRMKRNGTFIDPHEELVKQEGKRLDADNAQAFATVVGNIQQRYRQTLDLPANRTAP